MSPPRFATPRDELPDPPPLRAEFERKAVHLLTVIIPFGLVRMDPTAATTVLGAIAATALAADVLRARLPRFEGFVERLFGRLMRRDEKGDRVRINGATWLFLGGFLAVLLFGVRTGSFGLATFIVADAIAGLVGFRYGRRRWLGTNATLLGSVAFFGAALAVGLFLPGIPFRACLIAAAVSTVAEAATPVNDNLVVPAIVASVYHFL